MHAPIKGRRWVVATLATLAVLVLASGTIGNIKPFQPAPVSADAETALLGTITATVVPVDPSNPNGPTVVYLRGQWNWYTHTTDCNFDRAGAGVGLIWNDSTEPGYTVTNGTVSADVGVATLRAGDTANTIDKMVHPADLGNVPEGYPGNAFFGQTFNDPAANPNNYGSWRGGCGREALTSTASPCTTPNTGYTNYGCQSPTAESTGQSCGDGTVNCNGHPWGSWGYTKNAPCSVGGNAATCTGYSHTYAKASDVTKVCVNIYDVYNGGGGFVPASAAQIDVTQNTDNSIQANSFNPAQGANCITFAAIPTVTTALTPGGPVSIGTPISDQATLHGATPTAGGTISYRVYTSAAACTADTGGIGGTDETPTPNTVSADAAPGSKSFTPATAGTYWWLATYSGDSNNTGPVNSGCAAEPITVSKASPRVVTTASAGGAVGTAVTDSATISAGSSPTGNLVFTLYGPAATATCTTAVYTSTSVAVTGNGTYGSPAAGFAPTAAGTYYWIAAFTDTDGINNNATTACGDSGESVTIGKASPRVVTTASAGGAVGTAVTDSATISAGSSPTGNLVFTLYGPAATATCTTAVYTSTSVAVTGNGTYGSPAAGFAPTAAGTYYWIAAFTDTDGNNNNATTACGDSGESVTVNVDAAITLTPGTATNITGNPHTLTATVTLSDGSPVSGAPVTFSYVGSTNATPASPTGCTTTAAGTCTTTINDTVAQTVTVRASSTFNVPGLGTVTRSTGASTDSHGDGIDAQKTYFSLTTAPQAQLTDQLSCSDSGCTSGDYVFYTMFTNSSCTGTGTSLTPVSNQITTSTPASNPDTFNSSTSGTTHYYMASLSHTNDITKAYFNSPCAAEQATLLGQ